MGRMSKRKGSIFELKIYKKLKPMMPDLERISGSGNIKDGYCDLENAEYAIECKHYRHLSRKQLKKFLFQVECKTKKIALVVFRENAKDTKVLFKMNSHPVIMYLEDFQIYAARKLIAAGVPVKSNDIKPVNEEVNNGIHANQSIQDKPEQS